MHIAILVALISLASLTDARSVERALPQTESDDAFVGMIWDSDWQKMNWDKSIDGSLWLYVDGVMLIKNGENVTAIWGLKAPKTAGYQIVTDDLAIKTQAFTDAVNSTELKVWLVENPHKAQGYRFFFRQGLDYNGTMESIEGPIEVMREHLKTVSAKTVFRNLVPDHEWFWDSQRAWTNSSWSR